MTPWRLVFLAFAVIGLAWRLWLAGHIYEIYRPGTPKAGDAATYLPLAENILAGNGYTVDLGPPYTPFVSRPPTYPVFLALALHMSRGSHRAVVAAQSALDLATGFLLAALSHHLWPVRKRLSLVVFAVWATCPAVGSVAGRLQAEVLATFLFTSSLLLIVDAAHSFHSRIRVLVAASGGAVFMLAILARPQLLPSLVAIPMLITVLIEKNGKWRRSATVLVAAAFTGAALIEVPWAVRNLRLTGRLTLLGSGWGEQAVAMGMVAERRVESVADVRRRLESQRFPSGDGQRVGFLLRRISENPTHYLLRSVKRAVLLWASPRTAIYGVTPETIREALRVPHAPTSLQTLLVALAFSAYYITLLAVASVAVWKHRRDRAFAALIIAGPIAITVMSMWVHLESRYVLPAFPVVALATALQIDEAISGKSFPFSRRLCSRQRSSSKEFS